MKHQVLKTTPEISKRMSNVSLKGSKAETALAKELWHRGIRYRKNMRTLPGSPDIAITKYRVAVFVDGEFWHGENWSERKQKLKSNRDYWIEKIEENISRDKRNDALLVELGWTPVHFWEKEIKKDVSRCADSIVNVIQTEYARSIDLL
ncbi:MAG: very short patch repair endonuclease [Firmicutes bacterium]|nr:very short patch repair endonuclease [Bacillota bacterium]